MRRRVRGLVWLVALAPGITLGCQGRTDRDAALRETEILWDSYGVPHIWARDAEELFYAYGWAQMKAHGDLVLRLYGQARGRAAEYWGEEYLASDRWVRTVGIPQRGVRWYRAQSPAFRRRLDAFAAGMNDYARRHPEQISDEVEVVLPVSGPDVLAHAQRAVHYTFVASPWYVEAARSRWLEGAGRASAGEGRGERGAAASGGIFGALEAGPGERRATALASNAWAISPSRSEGGHALLLANPHLPWSDLFIWFESQLVAPGIDAYGAALVGFPILGIAFNEHLGWTHTVNTHDGADLYELTLAEGGYRWDGGVRPFDSRREVIRIRGGNGPFAEDTLVVRESVHGPVVAADEGRALALRVVGLEEPHLFEQYWDMAGARSLQEFEEALRRLQMPTFTLLYADREGNILHLFGGRTPVRPSGDWDWAGIVPGDTSETLWTEVHPYDDLPRVLNPASGWLQNANDPPWSTTFPPPLSPDAFPAYLAPAGRGLAPRPQRSVRMLEEAGRISFEEMVEHKHSTRMEMADRILDELLAAARRRGDGRARRAADVLEGWERSADAESRGAVLFDVFHDEAMRRGWPGGFYRVPWDPERPLETPAGLRDPESAVRALEAAARRVEERYGRLAVPWGQVHRLRRDGLDLLGNGGSGALGIFRVVDYDDAADGRRVAVGGDSFVAAVEFSAPVRARALVAYGNWSQSGSPHRVDQLSLFARKELRPVWRTRAEVEANLRAREAPEVRLPRRR